MKNTVHLKKIIFLLLFGVAGIGLWYKTTQFTIPHATLTLSRNEAITKATDYLTAQGIDLTYYQSFVYPMTYHISACQLQQQRLYVHTLGNPELYGTLMGTYLLPAFWLVRFARFTGTETERALQYIIFLNSEGTVIETFTQIPQSTPGSTLSEPDARSIAIAALEKQYNVPITTYQETECTAIQQPARTDWRIVFEDKRYSSELKEAKAVVGTVISGDTPSTIWRSMQLPAQWLREQGQQYTRDLIRYILVLLCALGIFIYCLRTANLPHTGIAWWFKLIAFVSWIVYVLTRVPLIGIYFNTSTPLVHQALMAGINTLLVSALIFIIALFWWRLLLRIQLTLDHTTASDTHLWQMIAAGVVGGMGIAGVHSASVYFFPVMVAPLWPDYSMLGTYWPSMTVLFGTFSLYASTTALMCFGAYLLEKLVTTYTRLTSAGPSLLFGMMTGIHIGINYPDITVTTLFQFMPISITGLIASVLYIFICTTLAILANQKNNQQSVYQISTYICGMFWFIYCITLLGYGVNQLYIQHLALSTVSLTVAAALLVIVLGTAQFRFLLPAMVSGYLFLSIIPNLTRIQYAGYEVTIVLAGLLLLLLTITNYSMLADQKRVS